MCVEGAPLVSRRVEGHGKEDPMRELRTGESRQSGTSINRRGIYRKPMEQIEGSIRIVQNEDDQFSERSQGPSRAA